MNFAYGVIVIVGVLVAIILGFIAISPDDIPEPRIVEMTEKPTTSAALAPPVNHVVEISEGSGVLGCDDTNECYLPYNLEIRVSDTVIWNNDDSAAHTVTSISPDDGSSGIFDSGLFMAGDSFEFTFNEAGAYDYFCMVHPWMTGIINVS